MMIHDQEHFREVLSGYGYDVHYVMNEQFLTEQDCLKLDPVYDGWIAGDDKITKDVIDHLIPRLKVVSKWGTGIDSIDVEYARSKGLRVLNSPGAFRDAVGELALAYLLALTRGILQTHISVASGGWPKTRFRELSNLTVGVVGMGAIGEGVAERVKKLSGRVIFTDPARMNNGYEKVELKELMKLSDVIIITCDLNSSTIHLINEETLRYCDNAPYLINVSRGPIVDEASLFRALKDGVLSGAALDVYEEEPLPNESPLRSLRNVIFGSHNANNTYNAVKEVHRRTIANLNEVLCVRSGDLK